MKRLPRDPIRFDLANAFAEFGREDKVDLRDPATADSFVERVRGSVRRSLSNDALLHGIRTQSMFKALVASLGAVELLKEEDAGEIYASQEGLEVPDLRLVLRDGSQMLVEVKNFYQRTDPRDPFELSSSYLDGLIRYSAVVKCELFIAIHWAAWNVWTLVLPTAFSTKGNRRILPMTEALLRNQMVRVGDYMVGCKFPLSLTMYADKSKPRLIGLDGKGEFTIENVELHCAGEIITNPAEKRIATFLMFYGKWNYETEAKMDGSEIETITHRWVPDQDHDQGFEILGSVSEMFSTFYRFRTQEDNRLTSLDTDVTPGLLGQLFPEDYEGDKVPLWRMRLRPAEKEDDTTG